MREIGNEGASPKMWKWWQLWYLETEDCFNDACFYWNIKYIHVLRNRHLYMYLETDTCVLWLQRTIAAVSFMVVIKCSGEYKYIYSVIYCFYSKYPSNQTPTQHSNSRLQNVTNKDIFITGTNITGTWIQIYLWQFHLPYTWIESLCQYHCKSQVKLPQNIKCSAIYSVNVSRD